MNKQLNLILIITIILTLFTTCKKNKPVTLTIMGETTVSDITANSAVLKGNVLEIGENMQVYGHVWGETEEPVISSNLKSEHTDAKTGSFVDELTNLKPETKYYVRSYAKDGEDVVYKDAVSFTTLPVIEEIILITDAVSNIRLSDALCGGNVISEGESPVTVKGICWSTSENPTINDFKTEDGSGTGTYTSEITKLTFNTTYYVRAYASNSEGTVYGEQRTFTTGSTINVGDYYQGGIVFYTLGSHGLICSLTELNGGNGTGWGCRGTEIDGADGTTIGTGPQNTSDILDGCSTVDIAAYLCANVTLNGYDDWFLPSLGEMQEMNTNKDAVNTGASNNYGTSLLNADYWTSTEEDNNRAYRINLDVSSSAADDKDKTFLVRAVRAY